MKLTLGTLDQLIPVNRLNQQQRKGLIKTVKGISLKQGQELKAEMHQQYLIYLIKGELELLPMGMEIDPMEGGALDFHEPVFANRKDQSSVKALTDCTLLRFDYDYYEQATQVVADEQSKADEKTVELPEADLFHEIFIACNAGAIELPPMPEVAAHIRVLASNQQTSTADLIKVIQVDPAIAGRIVFAANSAFYRGRSQIVSVKEAIVRMGFEAVSRLAMSIALHSAFKAKSPAIKARMHKTWQRAVQVSSLSYVLANELPGLDPEEALFAGLLYDIGTVPILNYAEGSHCDWTEQDLELTIASLRDMVGLMVVESWQLKEALEQVINHAHDWNRVHDGDPDYCDVVIAAQLYADRLECISHADRPQVTETFAIKRLNQIKGVDDDSLEILHQAKEQIEDVRTLLTGT
ncbi:MAG: HDOD domain-containing protein [bacterium]